MSYDTDLFRDVSDGHYKDTSAWDSLSVKYIGAYSSSDWWSALRVSFTPKKTLSSITFTLKTTGHQTLDSNAFVFGVTTSSSTSQPSLTKTATPSIPAELKPSTAANYTVMITQTFNAGTTYYLWVRKSSKSQFGKLTHASSNFYELDGTEPTPVVTDGVAKVRVSGAWADYVPYIRVSGEWVQYEPYVYYNGGWRKMV